METSKKYSFCANNIYCLVDQLLLHACICIILFHAPAESRHTGHVFSDCDDKWIHIMEHLIGQHHVDHCIYVHTHVEILMVASAEPSTNTSGIIIAIRMW